MAMLPTLPPGVVRVIAATNASDAATVAEGGTGAVIIEWTESYLTALRTALNITAAPVFDQMLSVSTALGDLYVPLTESATAATFVILSDDYDQAYIISSDAAADNTITPLMMWVVPYVGVTAATTADVVLAARVDVLPGAGDPSGTLTCTVYYFEPGDLVGTAVPVTPASPYALTETIANYTFSLDMSAVPLGSWLSVQFTFTLTEVGGFNTVSGVTLGGRITATA